MDNTDVLPGPINPSVYKQNKHVGEQVWKDGDESTLRSYNYNFLRYLDDRVASYVRGAGFYGLLQLGYQKVDRDLISALVDRWRLETHTFHFPLGECTFMLQDMEILGGICVDGLAVICDESNDTVDVKLNRIEHLLGIMPDADNIDEAGSHIKVKWLQQHFTKLSHNPTPTIITRFARATIMLLLSSQFLSDKRGAQAPTCF